MRPILNVISVIAAELVRVCVEGVEPRQNEVAESRLHPQTPLNKQLWFICPLNRHGKSFVWKRTHGLTHASTMAEYSCRNLPLHKHLELIIVINIMVEIPPQGHVSTLQHLPPFFYFRGGKERNGGGGEKWHIKISWDHLEKAPSKYSPRPKFFCFTIAVKEQWRSFTAIVMGS